MVSGYLNWSEELFDLFGLDSERTEANFDIWRQILHPEDVAIASRRIDEAIKAHTALDSDYRIVHPDGQVRWIKSLGSTLYDPAGQPVRMTGICLDITGQKQAEEALRASETRFRTLFEQTAVGVALVETRTGHYVHINQKYCDFLGYTQEEMLHRTFQDVTHPDDTQTNIDYNTLLITGAIKEFTIEKRYLRKDGAMVWANLTASPLWKPGEAPQTHFHIAVAEDITARKLAEDRLRATLADLQRSNADLEQFAYVASHDLQEPLRMVASYVQLLGINYRGRLDADADEFIGYAMEGAKRMQQLLLDLLEYARVGTRGAPPQPTDATVVCLAAIQDLEVAIRENDATVTYDPLPTVNADAVQLGQLFLNLIGNAIKFHGPIRRTCTSRPARSCPTRPLKSAEPQMA